MLQTDLKRLKKETVSETEKLIEEISKYNTIDFIMGVSALMLIPQNQSKTIIFQAMLNAALTLPAEKTNLKNKMSITTFKKIVREFEKTSVSFMVDPPEFPFVLPVVYFHNPYVFMGNNTISPINLGNLLKVLEVFKKDLNYEKYNSIKNIVNGLLCLSNDIAKSLNIKMEELKFYPIENDIFIPDKITLERYKSSMLISSKEMESIFGDTTDNFITEFESINKEDILFLENPQFIYKPFVKYKNNYVLMDITCILPLIFRTVIKETYGLENINIINEYNKLNSLELRKRFFMLGCHELTPPNIEIVKGNDYEERLFLMGNDGVLISIQLFDDGSNFNFENSDVKFSRGYQFISKRIKYLINFMISNGVDSKNILIIVSPYTLGRDFSYSLKKRDMKNNLILSLYEISAISINEENNEFFLKEYIDARKLLKYYEKNLFSELNFIALFVNNDYSFYLGDEMDTKDAFLSFIGEYSSDYILKSYLHESKKLCKFYKGNSLIEVIKMDKSVYIAPQMFLEKLLNMVIVDGNSTIWIISNNNTMADYSLFHWLADLISYWICEMLPLNTEEYNITIELKIDNKLYNGIKPMITGDDISSIIKYEIDGKKIIIYVNEELCNYFTCDTNVREKDFIKYLMNLLNDNYNLDYDETKFDEVFNNPYKRKTINIDSISGAYMLPSKNKHQCRVSKAHTNIILDDIGLYLKNVRKYNYGLIEDSEVFVKVVGYLYKRLLTDLKIYSKHDLICYLYEMYDGNLGDLLIRQHYYAYDITCYPEHIQDIKNNINEMTKLSVALRFLIELASSFKDDGNKNISFYGLNKDLAISSQIIEWAYVGDLLHYDMISSDIRLLNSNRIGFDKTASSKINLLMMKSMFEKNSVSGIEKLKRVGKFLPKAEDKNDNFDMAFNAEFGYSFDDYKEVTITILDLFKDNFDSLIEIKIDDVKENVQREISYEVIEKIINSLSLTERDDFLKPELPYTQEEVYPWRFNRGLSLTRKPLIKYKDKYIVGYRTLINSVQFLLNLINDGKLHSYTKEMKDYEARRNNIKGKQFNDQVYNYISSFDSLIVKKNIKKINKKYISDEKNNTLGDIDVLYISIKKKTIGLVETKNLDISKNYYEIQNEYKKMFDESNPKCFYNKHKKRVRWIEQHLTDVIDEFNLPKGKWKIKDMFVVEDYIISKKAFKVKVNIHTLRDLTEKSLY